MAKMTELERIFKNAELAEVESAIKKLVNLSEEKDQNGSKTYSMDVYLLEDLKERRSEFEDLAELRRGLLYDLFVPSEAAVRRYEKINSHLRAKARSMCLHAGELYQKILPSCRLNGISEGFIECSLSFCWSEDAVLNLPDDKDYSSDFNAMLFILSMLDDVPDFKKCISLKLDDFQTAAQPDGVQRIARRFNNLDDILAPDRVRDDYNGWAEGPLALPEFDGIFTCYFVHCLCIHQWYSLPDLLRMNNFNATYDLNLDEYFSQYD